MRQQRTVQASLDFPSAHASPWARLAGNAMAERHRCSAKAMVSARSRGSAGVSVSAGSDICHDSSGYWPLSWLEQKRFARSPQRSMAEVLTRPAPGSGTRRLCVTSCTGPREAQGRRGPSGYCGAFGFQALYPTLGGTLFRARGLVINPSLVMNSVD
jgi:hypothetical protein